MKKIPILLFSILISFNSVSREYYFDQLFEPLPWAVQHMDRLLPSLDFSSNAFCDKSPKVQKRNGFFYLPNHEEPFSGENLCIYEGNGQYHSQGNILKGLKEGKWTWWYKYGQKEFEANYKNGLLDGKSTAWFQHGPQSGEGIFKKGTGTYIQYYDNGQKFAQISYKDGIKDGEEIYWYKNGEKDIQKNYKDGLHHGTYTLFHDNGQIYLKGNYIYGSEDGKWNWWYENGQKMEESNYKNGIKHGKSTSWDENGQIWNQVNFKEGELVNETILDGISIGDSLLEHFNMSEINKWIKTNYPKSKKFIKLESNNISLEGYDSSSFHLKENDADYIIYGMSFIKFFGKENINQCLDFKDTIVEENIELYKNIEPQNYEYIYESLDDGKSIAYITDFEIEKAFIRFYCVDWSLITEERRGFEDNFSYDFTSDILLNWLKNEAH
tara:strand:- start:813 stop:2129 length:1317 start_codon:yes stop_codon:yes gene_type:complete